MLNLRDCRVSPHTNGERAVTHPTQPRTGRSRFSQDGRSPVEGLWRVMLRNRPPSKRVRKPAPTRNSTNPHVKREIHQLFANLLLIRRQIRKWARMSRMARKKMPRAMSLALSALGCDFQILGAWLQ